MCLLLGQGLGPIVTRIVSFFEFSWQQEKFSSRELSLTASAALRALSLVTSSTVPWISTMSTFWLRSSMTPERMAWTSASLFLLPVMKFRWVGRGEDDIFANLKVKF